MEKSIMVLLLALFTNLVSANTKTDSLVSEIKSQIPDSSQVTFKEVYTDIKAGLSGLAESLKVGSEHVYGVLVKQQVVKSVTGIVVFIMSILMFIIFAKQASSSYKKWKSSRNGYDIMIESMDGLVSLTFGVICIVSVVTFIGCIFESERIITGFINPEYGALKDIMEFVKK